MLWQPDSLYKMIQLKINIHFKNAIKKFKMYFLATEWGMVGETTLTLDQKGFPIKIKAFIASDRVLQ